LIKNGVFSLSGKKSLLKSEAKYEIVLIDATESPVERPKKTKKILFWKEKKTHLKDTGGG
jgi:hypothetical protein